MSEPMGEGELRADTSATGEVDDEAIERRAYEISQGEDAGSVEENWRRAEEELRGPRPSGA